MDSGYKKKRSQGLENTYHQAMESIIISETDDDKLVNVTRVALNDKLTTLFVGLTIFDGDIKPILKELHKKKPYIRHLLMHSVRARRVPEISFFYDKGIDNMFALENLDLDTQET